MLLLLNDYCGDTAGYSYSVDYWSLGITIYRLLTGKIPFSDAQVCTFIPFLLKHNTETSDRVHTNKSNKSNKSNQSINNFMIGSTGDSGDNESIDPDPNNSCSSITATLGRKLPVEYIIFLNKLQLISVFCSQASIQIIIKLLEIDENKRLGGNLHELKAEPFFNDINWSQLIRKKSSPPVLPLPIVTSLNIEELNKSNMTEERHKNNTNNINNTSDNYFYVSASKLSKIASKSIVDTQKNNGKTFTQLMDSMSGNYDTNNTGVNTNNTNTNNNTKYKGHSVVVGRNEKICTQDQHYFETWYVYSV